MLEKNEELQRKKSINERKSKSKRGKRHSKVGLFFFKSEEKKSIPQQLRHPLEFRSYLIRLNIRFEFGKLNMDVVIQWFSTLETWRPNKDVFKFLAAHFYIVFGLSRTIN
jgi:hypothetical protein